MNRVTALIAAMLCAFLGYSLAAQERQKGLVEIKDVEGNTGKRWAICIGINDYEDSSILDLTKARNDARRLGAVLENEGQFDHVFVMTDDLDPRNENYPRKRNILNRIEFIKEFIDPDDIVVVSFSGHGVSSTDGKGFLIAADTYPTELTETSVSLDEIISIFEKRDITKSLFLIDACREYFQENKGMNDTGLYARKYEEAEVAATFYATKEGWYSYEDPESNYGVFTRYLVDGLKGAADSDHYEGNRDGIVTFSELAGFVEEAVSEWAIEHSRKQKPYTRIYGEKYGDLALSAYVAATADATTVIDSGAVNASGGSTDEETGELFAEEDPTAFKKFSIDISGGPSFFDSGIYGGGHVGLSVYTGDYFALGVFAGFATVGGQVIFGSTAQIAVGARAGVDFFWWPGSPVLGVSLFYRHFQLGVDYGIPGWFHAYVGYNFRL